jgi:hypothetical protein
MLWIKRWQRRILSARHAVWLPQSAEENTPRQSLTHSTYFDEN